MSSTPHTPRNFKSSTQLLKIKFPDHYQGHSQATCALTTAQLMVVSVMHPSAHWVTSGVHSISTKFCTQTQLWGTGSQMALCFHNDTLHTRVQKGLSDLVTICGRWWPINLISLLIFWRREYRQANASGHPEILEEVVGCCLPCCSRSSSQL